MYSSKLKQKINIILENTCEEFGFALGCFYHYDLKRNLLSGKN